MNDKKIPLSELIFLTLGEVAVSVLTVIVYLLLGKFNYTVVTGVVLGSAIILLNFIFLCVSVNRAVDAILAERGDGELDEEQAAKFANEHKGQLNKTIQLSHTVRTLSIVGVLIVAFIIGHFDVIATVIPVAAFRPILMLGGLVLKKER